MLMKEKTIEINMEYWNTVAKVKGNNNDLFDWVDAESLKAKEEGYDILLIDYQKLDFVIFQRSVQNDLEIGLHRQYT